MSQHDGDKSLLTAVEEGRCRSSSTWGQLFKAGVAREAKSRREVGRSGLWKVSALIYERTAPPKVKGEVSRTVVRSALLNGLERVPKT